MAAKTTTKTTSQELEQARKILAQREQARDDAAAEIDAVTRSWEAGDDTQPASRLSELNAELDRLNVLIDAAQRQVQAAENAWKLTDPILAARVAQALGDGYQVTEEPGRAEHANGTIGGTVRIRIDGCERAEDYNGRKIVRTLTERHLGAREVGGRKHYADGIAATFEIRGALPPVPVVTEVDTAAIQRFCNYEQAQTLLNRTRTRHNGNTCRVKASTTVTDETITDGVRRLTVEATLTAKTNETHLEDWDLNRTVREAEGILHHLAQVGDGIVGVGTIENVDTSAATEARPGYEAGTVTARIVFVSKTTDR